MRDEITYWNVDSLLDISQQPQKYSTVYRLKVTIN